MDHPKLTIEVKGKFGAGRSTMALMLKAFLKAKGFTVEVEDVDGGGIDSEDQHRALQGYSNNVLIKTVQAPRSRADLDEAVRMDGGF